MRPILIASCLVLAVGCGDDTPAFFPTGDVSDTAADASGDVPLDADADDADAGDDTEDTATAGDASSDTPVEPDTLTDAPVDEDSTDEPDVEVEVRELALLVVGPTAIGPSGIAEVMGSAIDAHPHFELRDAEGIGYTDQGLLGFAYRWTGRDERLAPLSGEWDVVVLIDSQQMPFWSAGAHFEGTRVLAEIATESGAQPVLAINGGAEEVSYRVGNGLGVPVLPVQAALAEAGAAQSQWSTVAAATLLHKLTEVAGMPPVGVDEGTWAGLLAGAARVRADDTPRYDTPWDGAVRIDELPLPTSYNFMIAGTSSENGWRTHMNSLLSREDIAHTSVTLGQCTMYRSVDQACAETAQPHFEAREYMSIYARAYDVTLGTLQDLGGGQIQAQIYDRHWDATGNDGTLALDEIEDRTLWVPGVAEDQGLAWLPQHINFARLKYELPGASLLTDGTHATAAVQDGLAAMSFVSRTGLSPTTEGLSEESASAVRNGEAVIRQLSALSKSGDFVPDVRADRPSLR